MEPTNCPNLAVPIEVMHHIVRVESSYNPYAIGVVGGRLVRQPESLPEALATARMLESKGYNFSLGLAQVNRYNLKKYGLRSYEAAFQVCPNLQAGSRILAECHHRSGGDWGKSFSCYYSGNFVTGYRHGYVQKIYASMRTRKTVSGERALAPAIAVISFPSRRNVEVTRHPLLAERGVEPGNDRTLMRTSAGTSSSQAVLIDAQTQGQGAATVADGVIGDPRPVPQSPVDAGGVVATTRAAVDEAFVF